MKKPVYLKIEAKIPVEGKYNPVKGKMEYKFPNEVDDFLNSIGIRDDAELETWWENEDGDVLFM